MNSTVFDRIAALLTEQNVSFDVLEHEPVFTSEEAAAVRGSTLSSGAKALICKADQTFLLFVMPADRRLDSKNVRKTLGLRSLRFGSRDEIEEITGLRPGSIPPFGSLFKLHTHCDLRLADEEFINFNAGDHSRSIRMAFDDFAQVESPTIGIFAKL